MNLGFPFRNMRIIAAKHSYMLEKQTAILITAEKKENSYVSKK